MRLLLHHVQPRAASERLTGPFFRSHRIRPQSFPICYMAARFVITPADLRGCWRFVALSIASCALPALLASLFRRGAEVAKPAANRWADAMPACSLKDFETAGHT